LRTIVSAARAGVTLTKDDLPMNEPRYSLRQEKNGFWTVLDVITRLPAASDGRDLTGLDHDDAKDIADALNRDYLAGRKSPLV
jgi:hypothetical protein